MSKILKAAREASGKTQAEVAKEVGITARGYQKIEAKGKYKAVQTAIHIADALGVEVSNDFRALWEQQDAPDASRAEEA